MQFAHILPTSLLSMTPESQKVHLILIHVLAQDPTYAEFYRQRAEAGELVILDNSAYERGGSVDEEEILEWIYKIRPGEIVLPDVLFDRHATLERSKAFLIRIKQLRREGKLPNFKVMAVPQGNTAAEWFTCFENFRNSTGVDTIGVFLKAGGLFEGGRAELLRRVQELKRHSGHEWHLLGMDNGLVEPRTIPGKFRWVRSTDSTKFVNLGLEKLRASTFKWGDKCPPRPDGYFEMPAPKKDVIRMIQANLETATLWAQGQGVS